MISGVYIADDIFIFFTYNEANLVGKTYKNKKSSIHSPAKLMSKSFQQSHYMYIRHLQISVHSVFYHLENFPICSVVFFSVQTI